MASAVPYRAADPIAPPAPITASRAARRRDAAENTKPFRRPPAALASWFAAMAGSLIDGMAANQQPADYRDERAEHSSGHYQPGGVQVQPGDKGGDRNKESHQQPDQTEPGRLGAERGPAEWPPAR